MQQRYADTGAPGPPPPDALVYPFNVGRYKEGTCNEPGLSDRRIMTQTAGMIMRSFNKKNRGTYLPLKKPKLRSRGGALWENTALSRALFEP